MIAVQGDIRMKQTLNPSVAKVLLCCNDRSFLLHLKAQTRLLAVNQDFTSKLNEGSSDFA